MNKLHELISLKFRTGITTKTIKFIQNRHIFCHENDSDAARKIRTCSKGRKLQTAVSIPRYTIVLLQELAKCHLDHRKRNMTTHCFYKTDETKRTEGVKYREG